ncbi:MAG: biotin/lipoyl-containing protein, partial [Gammaproteobacteria bacterium]
MTNLIEIIVPDLSGASDVPVVEIFVSAGQEVAHNETLISIETEKTIIDIPATVNGVVKEVIVKVGDRVIEEQVLMCIESVESDTSNKKSPSLENINSNLSTQVVVIGSGPGGYSAAFRAAD